MIQELLLELDKQARTSAIALEARGKLPAGFSDHHYPLTRREQLELRRLKAAAIAATDLDTYLALARGDAVPASRLNRRVVDHHYRTLARGR